MISLCSILSVLHEMKVDDKCINSLCTHIHRIVAYPYFVQYKRLVGVNVPESDVNQLILGQTEMTSRIHRDQ